MRRRPSTAPPQNLRVYQSLLALPERLGGTGTMPTLICVDNKDLPAEQPCRCCSRLKPRCLADRKILLLVTPEERVPVPHHATCNTCLRKPDQGRKEGEEGRQKEGPDNDDALTSTEHHFRPPRITHHN